MFDDEPLRYAVAALLIGSGIVRTASALSSIEPVPPAYFAVAIGAGAAAIPASWSPVCWLRSRVPALRR